MEHYIGSSGDQHLNYKESYIWTTAKDMDFNDWSSQLYTKLKKLWDQSLKTNPGLNGIPEPMTICDTGAVWNDRLIAQFLCISSIY